MVFIGDKLGLYTNILSKVMIKKCLYSSVESSGDIAKVDIAKHGVKHVHAIIKKSIVENVNGSPVF